MISGLSSSCAYDPVSFQSGRKQIAKESDWIWKNNLKLLDYAFQPIINIHTGTCIGYEALLRGWDRLGYSSAQALFDAAHSDEVLPSLEARLQQKVFARFCQIPHFNRVKLFYNLDPRILQYPIGSKSVFTIQEFAILMGNQLAHYGISPSALCLELTERMREGYTPLMLERLDLFRNQFCKLALDDFGTGISGLQLLYEAAPDFVKIDRFFIQDISIDARKRVLATTMVNMAHALGIPVIVEGVTNSREFTVCRQLGCDSVQGYFVQAPTLDLKQLRMTYETIGRKNERGFHSAKCYSMRPVEGGIRIQRHSELYQKRGGGNDRLSGALVSRLAV